MKIYVIRNTGDVQIIPPGYGIKIYVIRKEDNVRIIPLGIV